MSGFSSQVEFAALLGTYLTTHGTIGRITLPRGNADAPVIGTLAWEIRNLRPSQPVRMRDSYWPVPIEGFPARGAVKSGEIAAYPVPEAAALIAADLALAVTLVGGVYVAS